MTYISLFTSVLWYFNCATVYTDDPVGMLVFSEMGQHGLWRIISWKCAGFSELR